MTRSTLPSVCLMIAFSCALGVSGCVARSQADASGAASASASPAPVASGAPTAATGTASATVNPDQARQLLRELQKAQSTELKALAHRNSLEMREIRASQAARTREWESKERDARHKFFAEHQRGPERRAYIQDFVERHKAFDQMLADERQRRAQEQDARLKAIKADQAAKLREFQSDLKKGLRPPATLWPASGS